MFHVLSQKVVERGKTKITFITLQNSTICFASCSHGTQTACASALLAAVAATAVVLILVRGHSGLHKAACGPPITANAQGGRVSRMHGCLDGGAGAAASAIKGFKERSVGMHRRRDATVGGQPARVCIGKSTCGPATGSGWRCHTLGIAFETC